MTQAVHLEIYEASGNVSNIIRVSLSYSDSADVVFVVSLEWLTFCSCELSAESG